MAQVDLMGADAQRIRNQYQTSLQRDAGDNEVTGWLSGQYGGGGVDDWLRQIQNSDEARQRSGNKPPANTPPDGSVITDTPPGTNTTLDPNVTAGQATQVPWMPGQGPDPTLTWDPVKGWSRKPATTNTATTNTPWDVDPKGNFSNWFLQNTGGLAPSGKALESLAPYLAKWGIKLGGRNAAGMIDTVILPDGSAWDVIESATMDGGKKWQWIPAGGAGSSGSTGGRGMPGVNLPGNQYSDPYTRMLEDLIKSRLGYLTQPVNDPNRAMYEQALKDRASSLGSANTQVSQLMNYLQKRFTELQGPGYTGAENEAIRTQALDPIEADRAAAKQRVIERLSARGLNLESGIAQQALLEVDNAFDAMRGTTQTTLATNDLNRREDRQQRAATIGGQLVDIPDQRAREQLDVISALEILSKTARDEDQARSREAISYAGGLNDLSAQRLQLAMQAAGMGGNPASLLSGLTNVANLNMNAAALNSRNSGSMWSGIGSIMAILAGSGR